MAKRLGWSIAQLQDLYDTISASEHPLVRDRIEAYADSVGRSASAVGQQYYYILRRKTKKHRAIKIEY